MLDQRTRRSLRLSVLVFLFGFLLFGRLTLIEEQTGGRDLTAPISGWVRFRDGRLR